MGSSSKTTLRAPCSASTTCLPTMDRAIQIPLQEALPGHSRKKCKGELRRLGCLVGFCLVLQLFMALPMAYLLGAHFREQQSPRQEAVLGPEPAVGKYSALHAAESTAQKSRTMIHLQGNFVTPEELSSITSWPHGHIASWPPFPLCRVARYNGEHDTYTFQQLSLYLRAMQAKIPKIVPSTNYPILHWRGAKLELFQYDNGSLEVPEEGDYFIYSHITFEGPVQVCERVVHNSSSPTHLSQDICRGRKSYGSSVPISLLTGSTTITAKSVGPKCKPWRKSIYLGAVFHLNQGDRLMVNVSHINLVKVTETFFGLASLN